MKPIFRFFLFAILTFFFTCSSENKPINNNENSDAPPSEKVVQVTTTTNNFSVVDSTNNSQSKPSMKTGVPVFIGYTQKSVLSTPKKITSMNEFQTHFGEKHMIKFETPSNLTGFRKEDVRISGARFYLYESVEMFFKNGGRSCYIVSVGNYFDVVNKNDLTKPLLIGTALSQLKEADLIAIPDALALNEVDCYHTYQMVLQHCGRMKNRFAIFDIADGFNLNSLQDDVNSFRSNIGTTDLDKGAVYYPWVETSNVSRSEIGPQYFLGGLGDLKRIIQSMKASQKETAEGLYAVFFPNGSTEGMATDEIYRKGIQLSRQIEALDANYKNMMDAIAQKINVLPTAAILAGVYSSNDSKSGVWKSPANIGLIGVIKPSVPIDNDLGAILNVSATDGKSINAIRFFQGRGTLIWGARTLDGNSHDWRYISVRRLMNMLEVNLQHIINKYSFEPNDRNTWLRVREECEDFLEIQFRQGALQGASRRDAFAVRIGLGETMNEVDIDEGRMILSIGVAPLRPAEFIFLNLKQQMEMR